MNRILFEKSEIVDGVATFGGERAAHVLDVLHGEVGQVIKTGEVDGPVGTSEVVEILENGRPREDARLTMGDGPRGDARLTMGGGPRGDARLTMGGVVIRAKVAHTEKSIEPWIDLILAPPRPRVMKRLLPQLATMGVGRIVLVGAQKVERDFWGATLLKEENYRPLLIDGLMQGGTSILPKVECWKSFNRFLREGLAGFGDGERIVAHPYVDGGCRPREDARLTVGGGPREDARLTVGGRPLLAIGPEGGWTDEEVGKLVDNGFRGYSLGSRILRTDTATIALLAQLMQKYDCSQNASLQRNPSALARESLT